MTIRVYVRDKGAGRKLSLYYIDPYTGREVTKSARTNDKREAERKAAALERELLDYRGPVSDGWKYFRDRFDAEHLATLSTGGRAAYGTALNHLQRTMNPQRVSDVTANLVSLFQAKMLEEERKLTSVANYLTHIRSALNWAADKGIIDKAPRIKLPRQPKRVWMRGRPITEAEYLAMLEACDKTDGIDAPAWRRFMELLWLSGLRISEAMKLSWTDPPIVANLEADPFPQILYWAEGHKARRDDAVPMTPELAAWLERTPLKDRQGLVAPVPLETQPRVSDQITEFGKAANVIVNEGDKKYASAHDFRRAFGARWAQKVMPMTLQKLMRHADISTTLKYYVGLSSSDAGREIWGQKETVPQTVPKTSPESKTPE